MRCEYLTGVEPDKYNFRCTIEPVSDMADITFYVDAPVLVSWGDMQLVEYDAGFISGRKLGEYPIFVISNETVTTVSFSNKVSDDHSYKSIIINSGKDLLSLSEACKNLKALEFFEYHGANKCEDFSGLFDGCFSLSHVYIELVAYATNLSRMFYRCATLKEGIDIYSPVCLDASYMYASCVSLEKSPKIELPACLDFSGLYYNCASLPSIASIVCTSGQNFDYIFASCVQCESFPTLTLDNAVSLNYAYAANPYIKSISVIDSPNATSFIGCFKGNASLECIGLIDTTGIGTISATEGMFDGCDALVSPTSEEQAMILQGYRFMSTMSCGIDMGNSRFFMKVYTGTNPMDIIVRGDYCEVDWGNGVWIPYPSGRVHGMPLGPSIQVRSDGTITGIAVNEDTLIDVYLGRIMDFETMDDMFVGLSIKTLTIAGSPTKRITAKRMCYNCPSLNELNIAPLTNITDFTMAFAYCNNLYYVSDIVMTGCRITDRMFMKCSGISSIGNIYLPDLAIATSMFEDCIAMECIDSFSTFKPYDTTNMFLGTPKLIRPSASEQQDIMMGLGYQRDGDCVYPFNIYVEATGTFELTVDTTVQIDPGDGTLTEYPAGTITITPLGPVKVYGDVGSVFFANDVLTTVIFSNLRNVTDYSGMFDGFTNLLYFYQYGTSSGVTYDRMFQGTTSLIEVAFSDVSSGTSFVGMFMNSGIQKLHPFVSSNGTSFDEMFNGCGLLEKICEIDTSSMNVVPNELACDDSLACDASVFCHSSGIDMFVGCDKLAEPDAERQQWINNGYHYIGSRPC